MAGRRVAGLYEGLLEANLESPFTFDAADLPSALYVVRVVGETSSAARRVLLLR